MRTLGHHCQVGSVARHKHEDSIVSRSNVFTPHVFTPNLPARNALGAGTFPSRAYAWVTLPVLSTAGSRGSKRSAPFC